MRTALSVASGSSAVGSRQVCRSKARSCTCFGRGVGCECTGRRSGAADSNKRESTRKVDIRLSEKKEFKLPGREAGSPNHLDDKVDSDQ